MRNAKSTPKYIRSIQGALKASPKKKKEGLTKKGTPQQDPIQSTKSIIEEGPRVINNLDHDMFYELTTMFVRTIIFHE